MHAGGTNVKERTRCLVALSRFLHTVIIILLVKDKHEATNVCCSCAWRSAALSRACPAHTATHAHAHAITHSRYIDTLVVTHRSRSDGRGRPPLVCVHLTEVVYLMVTFILSFLWQAQRKEVFLQERYSCYSLTDPFLALQRDFECGVPRGDKERRPLGSSPMSVLEAVMAHCRKLQERMSAQLAAAESRQKRVRLWVELTISHPTVS